MGRITYRDLIARMGTRFKPNNYTSPNTTCEQKKDPSIPNLMHVGHWSFASSVHPEVWQTCVSIPAADIFVFIQEAEDYEPSAEFGNGDRIFLFGIWTNLV